VAVISRAGQLNGFIRSRVRTLLAGKSLPLLVTVRLDEMPIKVGLMLNEMLGVVQGLTGGPLTFQECDQIRRGVHTMDDLLARRSLATHVLEFDCENFLTPVVGWCKMTVFECRFVQHLVSSALETEDRSRT